MAHFAFFDTPQETALKAMAARHAQAADRVLLRGAQLLRLLTKYNPDQARVPAGRSDGGQWTDEGGGSSGNIRVAMADEERDRSDESDSPSSIIRQTAFNNSIRQLRRLDPNNQNLQYITDGSAPSWDVVNHVEQEVEKARTASAIKIASGHAFTDHAAEFGITSRSDFADLVMQIIRDPFAEVRDLSGTRTMYYKRSTNTVVFVQPPTRDGGTMFKPVEGQSFVNKQK